MKYVMTFLVLIAVVFLAAGQNNSAYELVWEDDFSLATMDEDNWRYHSGGGFWGGSIQYYTFGAPNNYDFSTSVAKLTAHEESYTSGDGTEYDYTSGAIRTQDLQSWTYGKIEARIKNPTGQGLWPAFWMSPEENVYGSWPHSGEIDILELLGHEPEKAHFALHCSTAPGHEYKAIHSLVGTDYSEDFHTFTLEWEPLLIKWLIDDELIATVTSEDLEDDAPWVFDTDFYLRLNVGVGGNWPGNPDATTVFPQTMEVDWVRVYQKPNIISNPHFDNGNNDWTLITNNGAAGVYTVGATEKAEVNPTALGGSSWHLELRQTDIELIQNNKYEVEFTAYADAPRDMTLILSKQDGSQYFYKSYSLTTEPQHFKEVFMMEDPSDANVRFNFGLGSSLEQVYIDDVRLFENDQALLPIELIDFSAERLNRNAALIKWQGVNAFNFNSFIVERSMSIDKDFKEVEEVHYSGASDYSFLDKNITADRMYYRLKLLDIDGYFRYSPVVSLPEYSDSKPTYSVAPNPVIRGTECLWSVDKDALIRIYNINGALILEDRIHTGSLNRAPTQPGVYTVVVESKNSNTPSVMKWVIL